VSPLGPPSPDQAAGRAGTALARNGVAYGGHKGRISQIEAGDVSTQDVLERYITALGGTLRLIADFGDEQLNVA
jgi:hypothetical protein